MPFPEGRVYNRKYIKPRLAKVINAAREVKPEIMIFYHGDGNLQKIILDLIEVGVDILNQVQPECMDPVEIKNKYGEKLSFWGDNWNTNNNALRHSK